MTKEARAAYHLLEPWRGHPVVGLAFDGDRPNMAAVVSHPRYFDLSDSERVVVDLARQLWNGQGGASLSATLHLLDDSTLDRLLEAVAIRRGDRARDPRLPWLTDRFLRKLEAVGETDDDGSSGECPCCAETAHACSCSYAAVGTVRAFSDLERERMQAILDRRDRG